MAVQNQVAGTVKQRGCSASWGGYLTSPTILSRDRPAYAFSKRGETIFSPRRRWNVAASEGTGRGVAVAADGENRGGISPKKGCCDIDSCGQARGSWALVPQPGARLPILR